MSQEQLVEEAYDLCVRLQELREKPWPTPGGRRHDLVNQLGAEAHFARLRRQAAQAASRFRRRHASLYPSLSEGRIGADEP